MKKASEWLSEFDGHSALDADECRKSYEEETGLVWPHHLKGRPVAEALQEGRKDPKGLQAWEGPVTAKVLAGYQVARAISGVLIPGFYSNKLGRGSEFRDYVEALKTAGL